MLAFGLVGGFLALFSLGGRASAQFSYEILHGFATGGGNPTSPLIQAADGNFYGTTLSGGLSGAGTVLHSFTFDGSDGVSPYAALVEGTDGNFYGTTSGGGTFQAGTVFKMDALGAVTILHSFNFDDGDAPYAALVEGTDGNFYGTTGFGGLSGVGTVFKMDALGAVTILHSFDRSDGAVPSAALVEGSDGSFYGTTGGGGPSDVGTVFKMDALGAVTILHSFNLDGSDGANPAAALVEGTYGSFYGTTLNGGAFGAGAVFKMDALGAVTILHSFNLDGSDGVYPAAALVEGTDGNFYGTTSGSGYVPFGVGTVFKMDALGEVTILHWFNYASEGAFPASLVEGTDGDFYGTTGSGGPFFVGTAFKIDVLGAVTILHSFDGSDGAYPLAALVEGTDGNFYGTAVAGGRAGPA